MSVAHNTFRFTLINTEQSLLQIYAYYNRVSAFS